MSVMDDMLEDAISERIKKENKPTCGWCHKKNTELPEGTKMVEGELTKGSKKIPYICTDCVALIHKYVTEGNITTTKVLEDGTVIKITEGLFER